MELLKGGWGGGGGGGKKQKLLKEAEVGGGTWVQTKIKTPHEMWCIYILQSLVPKYRYSPNGVFPTILLEIPVPPLWGIDISGSSHDNDYQMFKINQNELNRKTRVQLDERSAPD